VSALTDPRRIGLRKLKLHDGKRLECAYDERFEPRFGPLRSVVRPTRRLSRARSAHEPAVFLFEDLHWFDRAREAFLENMVDAAPGNRSLLAASDDRPRRDRGHRLASGRLETAPLEVFRLNDKLRKRATRGSSDGS
jgi:hypothetical protein